MIENSVIGVRSIIGENTVIRDSYLMGVDYYEQAAQIEENQRLGRPLAGVGAGSVIERAIIDKKCGSAATSGSSTTPASSTRMRPDARDSRRRHGHSQVGDGARRHGRSENSSGPEPGKKPPGDTPSMSDRAIRVKELRKQYPGRDGPVHAVNGHRPGDLPGECFGLLGPNGAGKTTTVEILEGLNRPTSGEVEVLGRSWATDPAPSANGSASRSRRPGFPTRRPCASCSTVFRSFYRSGLTVDEAIARVSLESKANALIEQLSGGQQQRLAVAIALVGDPELLFLDEPTTGLDPQSRRQLWEVIRDLRDRGRTVLLTTHYMDEAERLCDRVAIIDQGKIIALGSPRELIARLGGRPHRRVRAGGQRDTAGARDLRRARFRARGPGRRRGIRADRRRAPSGHPRPARRARQPGPPLARLTTRHVSLEDVFVVPHRPAPPRRRRRGNAACNSGGRRRRNRTAPLVVSRTGSPAQTPADTTLDQSLQDHEHLMLRNSPFFQLYRARLREFWRQPARIFWVYGFPTVLAVVLGLCVPEPSPGADPGRPGRRALAPPRSNGDRGTITTGSPAAKASPGDARGAVLPPVDRRAAPEDEADKRLNTGKTVLEIVPQRPDIVDLPLRPDSPRGDRRASGRRRHPPGGRRPDATRCQPSDIHVTEPGSRYIDFLIPGLIGLNAMGGGLWGIGFFLVNLRIGKLLKCFVATPMPRRDFLGAILASRLTFLIPDVTVLLLLGVLVFHMPIRGNLLLFFLIDVIGALAFAGIGLLVASRAQHHRDRQRAHEPGHAADVPALRASSSPSERFGKSAQPFIQALPLTQLVSALRLVVLEGAGPLPPRRPQGARDPRRLGRRHLLPGPPHLPLELSPSYGAGRRNCGRRRTVARSLHQPLRRCPAAQRRHVDLAEQVARNVALARTSTSRNDEPDCSGIAASFSTSMKLARRVDVENGNREDQTPRQAADPAAGTSSHVADRPSPIDMVADGRSPRAGARDEPPVQGSTAVVISTSGIRRILERPSRTASFEPSPVRPVEGPTSDLDASPCRLEPGDDGRRCRRRRLPPAARSRQDDPDPRARQAARGGSGRQRDRRRRATLPELIQPPERRRDCWTDREARSPARPRTAACVRPMEPPGDRPGPPVPIGRRIDLDHRHDLGRRAHQDQLVGRLQLVERDLRAGERNLEPGRSAGGQADGSSRAGSRAPRASPRAARLAPRAARCASPRSRSHSRR